MNQLTDIFKHWNFDKKMRMFISIVIILTALIIILYSSWSSVTSLMNKSKNLVQIQVNTVSDNLQMNLENFNHTSQSLMMDNQVQRFLKNEQHGGEPKSGQVTDVRDSMNIVLNMQNHINFISIFDHSHERYIYKGIQTMTASRYLVELERDFAASKATGYGSMRMSVNNLYFGNGDYTVTIYQPVYDKNRIGEVLGTLCFNMDEKGLFNIVQDQKKGTVALDLGLVDLDGEIVYSSDHEKIGSSVPFKDQLTRRSGSFTENKSLFVYERIGGWNYYVVGAIPMEKLTEDVFRTVIVMIAVVILIVALSLLVSSKMIAMVYAPMEKLVRKMENVSQGRLDVRVSEEKMGDDFLKISHGFNLMMDRINELLEQVKVEQRQVEQIRFNALQSQIQPHFLYNTLECIHWQAVMDGNRIVSKLVKALASYYRLCLSKGQDVITLHQELAHIESYLTIQNMRYDDIIDSDIMIDPIYYDVQIPKMTLQPLIENAIYHGIKIKEGKKGIVTIRAYEYKGDVIIALADSGSGMTEEEIDTMNNSISVHDESFGYGVRNVNKRIEILFGSQYGLHYNKNKEGGITVQIRLPLNTAEAREDQGHVQSDSSR